MTDDTLSGTTAVTMLMRGRRVFLSNVGDSRAVAAELQGTELVAVDLTSDQTPYRCPSDLPGTSLGPPSTSQYVPPRLLTRFSQLQLETTAVRDIVKAGV